MTSERTKLSNWIYRVILGLMLAGALKYGQFMYQQMAPVFEDTEGVVYWTTVITLMSGAVSLLVATLAMALRSGAVVWLLGLQFVMIILSTAPSLLAVGGLAVPILFTIAVLAILAVGIVLFVYLIKCGEIRRP